ncbi:lytic polysaccharide monooxygenase [Enterococcus wangshanyuanii]|uniref:Chitin-binding protein n=1 Tax=Enterococcus wangshanyuanii TaxID=2005703 RepID=A0ABQ1PH16_9ENTE|nr:lytic polysaccharide monooxygenase [Enterococcus wangshanyuanii]GGC96670.1 chitin-binding protein [Enterococcus wangshanyuanii]
MKKLVGLTMIAAVALGSAGLLLGDEANAHGYVESPASRGYQGVLDRNTLGWTEALNKYGNVITNPQSLEAPKGFPAQGPADGRIASANGGLGQIGDYVLDSTGVDRWTKQPAKTGVNTFTWQYTAPHSTSKWHYYITKNGWNPEKPLARENMQLIGEIKHDGSSASNNKSHQVTIPSDHTGYHVVLAVWDVADTPNAFYNVIDLNLTSDGTTPPEEAAPAKPTNLKISAVTTSSLKLTWDTAANASEYNIYRDSKKIGTVSGTQFNDTNLAENTTYSYQVEAVGKTGEVSEKSTAVKGTTQSSAVEDNETPTAPTNLHSMETTATSVDLMWTKSTHFLGVKQYDVYRDGKKITTTTANRFKDTGLKAETTYSYKVKAISLGGNVSEESTAFSVTTKEGSNQQTTWEADKIYNAGDKVFYEGLEYEAKWWTKGNRPDQSDVWKLTSNQVVKWDTNKAYDGGTQVTYQGKTYQAKYWTKGDQPGASSVWEIR